MSTLNIKNPAVVRLAEEIARLTGESKTEAIRRALEERKQHLAFRVAETDRDSHLRHFLESEIWPSIPPGVLGVRISREQEEELLGYGPAGV